MLRTLNNRRGGFTLVEIMIVVAIIALLASIAVPNFLRSRKRSQATQVLEDLRQIDSAIDQYAIERNKKSGDPVDWTDIRAYLKSGTRLEVSGGKDILGGAFTGFAIDPAPPLPQVLPDATTKSKLVDVAPPDFWSPFN
jgi:prepilin-type N-terminal cleavage/methylation domain-containing protein